MLSLGSTEFLAALLLLIISLACWPPKTRAFARRGWDPGFLGLKVWPARVYFFFKGHDVVETAYREAKDSPYLLQTLIEDVLVLPPKYLPELRMLPGSKLSASDALVVSVLGQYSGVDVILKDRQAYDVTRLQLTKSLPSLLPVLSQKADQVLSEALAACTTFDYTEINIQDVISNLVLRTTLLAFVGPQLADNVELHELIHTHPKLVRDIAVCLLFVPSFMRGWIHSFLPPSIRMRRLHRRMREILFGERGAFKGEQSFKTLLQHLIETPDPVDEEDIVAKILVVSGAALHTMTMSVVHAIIDLCAYPAHMAGLRSETAEHLPSLTPPWPADAIARLKVLDAFLKESQRFNSPNYLSFDRLAMTPITLSTGSTIPRRTYICMPAGSMAMDASFYPSPTEFSPERFHSAPETTRGNLDFVGTENGNVHWGSGRFTCPGRWYASATMKVFIALVVNKYDVRFPEGQVKRLPNVYMDILVEPNPKQVILVRGR